MDKAGVPGQGRIAIVDSLTEAALNLELANQAFINNPNFQGLVTTGFAQNNRFFRNLEGFDIYVNDRLPRVTETINGGPHASSKGVTGGVANFFMSVYSDMHMPLMGAWRRMPQIEVDVEKATETEHFYATARYGHGVQRNDTLITVIGSGSLYK